jgi:hypothetical protein
MLFLLSKWLYPFSQQYFTPVHMTEPSMVALSIVFRDRIVHSGLGPACSHNLSSCDFYLWGTIKQNLYRSDPPKFKNGRKTTKRKFTLFHEKGLRQERKLFQRWHEQLQNNG